MTKISSAVPIFLASSLVLAACGESPKHVPAQRSMAVQTFEAQYRSVPASVEAPGSVQPHNRITLSSQINGFVHGVNVRAGDLVTAGQTLVTLDARDAQSQKDMAQASIDEAQAGLEEATKGAQVATDMRNAAKANSDLAAATFQRFQKLFDAKSVSPQELDEVRARRDAAVAGLAAKETMVAAAQDRLKQVQSRISQANAQSRRADVLVGYTVLKAPAAGRVAERQVDPGSAIFPGSLLLVLETTANPQVLAEIPTAQIASLRVGLEVVVRLPDSGKATNGRVAEIVPLSNPSTHTVQFKVDLPSGFAAPTGSYANVSIPMGNRNVLLAPRKAVRETGQLTGVFVVDSGSRARFRLVRIAPFDTENVELLSGVEPGEKIVSAISDELTDGITLEVRS
jgi:multidrug efflux pump subunit AcrA (membrane-fusion protein)